MKIWKSKALRLTITYPDGPEPFPADKLTVRSDDDPFLADMAREEIINAQLYGFPVDKGGEFVPWEIDGVISGVFHDSFRDSGGNGFELVQGAIAPKPELPEGAVP
ncbi:hypothetical protein NEA10_20525 (plasmid) [Phormidium yuhuli AB48]|jgi:hypothetical protein|uniref:Phage protein n=1 Tax=Phormidium yuhuli AB48 TaxID=2940671 RepID=A0ABY5AWW8_9CYAN|nr:hypothetical protein [Phormidium yuhuli]USR93293.1 hypothetical protein NEA10_20525 [Phormidium yuhuli AB48]